MFTSLLCRNESEWSFEINLSALDDKIEYEYVEKFDLVFEDLVFEDLVFEDLVFEDLVFEDLVFEDLVFEINDFS